MVADIPSSTAVPVPADQRVGALALGLRLGRGLAHVALGALLCAAVFPFLRPSRRAGVIRWWARGFVAALGIRVAVEGAWPSQPGRYLLAANHVSWLDIFVIHSVHPVRFVSKSEVRSWPVAGFLASRAGTLFLDRARKRATRDIGAQMLEALEAGEAVGIFPEGTTSDGTVLLPFFSPLLQPAVGCAAEVVPTAIRYQRGDGERNTALAFIGEQTFLESVLITARQRGLSVRVRFGVPIASQGQQRRELTRQAERAVSELLGVAVTPGWTPDVMPPPPSR